MLRGSRLRGSRLGRNDALTVEHPALTKPTIESSQKPWLSVRLTILEAKSGTTKGFGSIQHSLSIFRKRIAFSLLRSVIEGRVLERMTKCGIRHADKIHLSFAGGP